MTTLRRMDGGFYQSLARAVVRHRWLVILLYALATAAMAWSGSRITLRSDITDLLPEGTPSADDLRFYLQRFGTADALFVTLRADTPGQTEQLEETATRLAAALDRSGLVRSVQHGLPEDDALAMLSLGLDHLPALVPAERHPDLRARLEPPAMREALTRARRSAEGALPLGPAKALLAEDPLGLASLLPRPEGASTLPVDADPGTGLFLSDDGTALLVVITPQRPPQDVPFARRLLAAVEQAEREALRGTSGIAADHAGGYLFAVQDEGRIRHDITVTASLSITAILVLFAVALRRAGLLLILLVPLTCSMIWTLGLAGLAPGHLNVVTVAFAAILLGVGDDALTHLYLRFREETARGETSGRALEEAMASTGPSILVASLTSGLSFASLTFVEFRGLSELGLIAAFGMGNLLVSVFLLFPCMLSLLPAGAGAAPPLARPMEALAALHAWARPRRRAVIGVAAAVTLAAGLSALRLEFSSDLATLRGDDPARERLESVLAPFGGLPDAAHRVHDAGDLEASLRAAEADLPALRRLAAEGVITGWSSPVLWLPSRAMQRVRMEALGGVDWDAAASAFVREAAALGLRPEYFDPFVRRLRRYGDGQAVILDPASLPDGLPASLRAGVAGSAVSATLIPAPGIDPATLAAELPAGGRLASVRRVVADLTAIIEKDFRRASLLALGMVLLASVAAFRSLRQLALVSVPVGVGCLLMLGALAAMGIPINLMNLVATPLVLGLGIDFGVYLVNRHEEEGRAGVPTVLRHTGGAILLTGLTTLSGFGSLLAADFAGLRSMGWVAVLGIAGCLTAALVLLPLLLPAPVSGSAAPPPGDPSLRRAPR
jgi:hypothetical protein